MRGLARVDKLKSLRVVGTVGLSISLLGLTQTIDLTRVPADLHVRGSESPPFPIATVVTGDINGDHIEDIIMQGGSPTIVSVVFGAKHLGPDIQLSETTPPDLVVTNIEGGTFPPIPMSVSDLNGDHIGDLLIPHENGLQVLWGRQRWPSQINAHSESRALRILAKDKVGRKGYATARAATGDLNNDGITDLVLTRIVSSSNETEQVSQLGDLPVIEQEIAWIFLGKKSWPDAIDLATQQPDTVLIARQPEAQPRTLREFAIGDLDGDGIDDIIAGSWDDVRGIRVPPPNAPWATAWLIPGRVDWPRKVELKRVAEPETLNGLPNGRKMSVISLDAWPLGMFVGGGLAVGNLVGDGKKDVVLSLVMKVEGEWRRQLCIIRGSADLFMARSLDLRARCSMVHGPDGFSAIHPTFVPRPLLGDFNGDGRSDLFIMFVRPEMEFKGLWGRETFPRELALTEGAQVAIRTPGARLGRGGYGFSTAMGDINGDRLDDLLIVDALGEGAKAKAHPGALDVIYGKNR